jgi:hypothetical protein
VYPGGLTQPEKNDLVPLLDFGELFSEFLSRAFDVLTDVARVGKATFADERMGSDSEAVVMPAVPVAQIVL